jgi:MSHA biogenesis protein MshK
MNEQLFKSIFMGLLLLTSATALAQSDPMRPPLTDPVAKSQQPSWVLNSILFSEERLVAVINQRPVRVGDRINGARVLAIYPESVRLSRADKTFSIKLQDLRVKQPVRGQ